MEQCIQSVINDKQYISPLITNELIFDTVEKKDDVSSMLTLTEKKVLEMVRKQQNTKQIAKLLFIAEKTVEWHRRNIIEKLGLPKEKNALLQWAIKNSLH